MIIKVKKDSPKPWWPGDSRVEPFMDDVKTALDRQGLTGQARTDVYNRAYEAVYRAILKYDKEAVHGRLDEIL